MIRKMLQAPAADRNKDYILQVLQEYLKPNKSSSPTIASASANANSSDKLQVLEIAAGTGQHVAHFAQSMPHVQWLPTEVDQRSLNSIEAYIKEFNLESNVSSPIKFDVLQPIQQSVLANRKASFDAILCTNMIHITPWACTEGLFSTSNYLLKPNGLLITYGPYSVNGILTPQSNISFDASLKMQNPDWGVRDISDLVKLGQTNQLQYLKSIDMPANNKMLIFQKS